MNRKKEKLRAKELQKKGTLSKRSHPVNLCFLVFCGTVLKAYRDAKRDQSSSVRQVSQGNGGDAKRTEQAMALAVRRDLL